jgi:hypothetical protein
MSPLSSIELPSKKFKILIVLLILSNSAKYLHEFGLTLPRASSVIEWLSFKASASKKHHSLRNMNSIYSVLTIVLFVIVLQTKIQSSVDSDPRSRGPKYTNSVASPSARRSLINFANSVVYDGIGYELKAISSLLGRIRHVF